MPYYSGQGRVYAAQRSPAGEPLTLRWLGNVPELTVNLSTETLDHRESYSGQRLTDFRLVTSKQGELAATLEEFRPENLELALYGVTSATAAGTVVDEALPTGVAAGDIRLLTRQFVSSVVVTDSAASPATLVAGTHYRVHAAMGAIEFLSVTGFTQPFVCDYAYGSARSTAMFRAPQPEVWLRFDGLNTADGNTPIIIDLYRVALDPVQDFGLVSNELQSFQLRGGVLADQTKPADGALGQFGRIILPGA